MWGLAYRMLGRAVDADDILQDLAEQWLKIDRTSVQNSEAWLIGACTRRCLDKLRKAKRRGEAYVGPWLPEPVPAARLEGARGGAETLESLSLAHLLLLRGLSSGERAVLVLYEMFGFNHGEIAALLGRSPQACRQALARARRRLDAALAEEARFAPVSSERLASFAAAVRSGEVARLLPELADDVVLVSDGGGKVISALKPIRGADRVARFVGGVAAKERGAVLATLVMINDGRAAALLRYVDGKPYGVALFDVERHSGRVSRIFLVRNPEKLSRFAAS